jgi:hypothetical protein
MIGAPLTDASHANQLLDRLFGNELAHAVIDATSGVDHLRVITQHVRLVCQIIRIDTDAVAADQTRTEGQEIPLAARSLQHLFVSMPMRRR